jgi:taurine--2-oxoglutarate transaminase
MHEIKDSQILPLSLEHSFWTWSAQAKVTPIPVNRAKGVYFWDVDGKRYLDFNSMTMCVNIGHGDERVINAIIEQARQLPYAAPGMATRPRAALGKLLEEITPGNLDHFLFTLGGADANENAIKLARAYTGRQKILARYRSYHGASAGAMALTGDPRRIAWEPGLMSGVVHFLDPYRYRSTFHRTNPDISEA